MGGTLLKVPAKLWTAKPICLILLAHFVRAAASRTFCTAGRSRPIRTAMIAITTSSSISVNAALRLLTGAVAMAVHLEMGLELAARRTAARRTIGSEPGRPDPTRRRKNDD